MAIKKISSSLALAVVTFGFASLAQASLIVTAGNVPQIDDNVIFNGCSSGVAITGPATTVAGCLNGAHGQRVTFTAEENIKANGGQARVDAVDQNGYQSLSIAVVGKTFDSLILNINAVDHTNGTVRFTDGVTTSAAFALDDDGSNFFTITGGDFAFIRFDTSVGARLGDVVQDTRQIRIGGISSPSRVPEPGSLVLAGLALAGFGARRLRSRA